MGLHIGVLRTEELLGAVAGEVLHHVHILAAAVIALAGIALCVFIGQVGAHRRQHSIADKVLGRNQLDVLALTGQLVAHGCAKLGVFRLNGLEVNHVEHRPFSQRIALLYPLS